MINGVHILTLILTSYILVYFIFSVTGAAEFYSATLFMIFSVLIIYVLSIVSMGKDYAVEGFSRIYIRSFQARWQVRYIINGIGGISLVIIVLGFSGFITATNHIKGELIEKTINVSGLDLYRKIEKQSNLIVKEDGYTYYHLIKAPFLFSAGQDSNYASRSSNLRVYENGVELKHTHSLHEDIRLIGLGRFSHWGKIDGRISAVYFSTADNSVYSEKHRNYRFVYNLTIHPYVLLIFLIVSGFLISVWIPVLDIDKSPLLNAIRNNINTIIKNKLFLMSLAIIVIGICMYPLYSAWIHATSNVSLIAGYFPWSDADGWSYSAKYLLNTGELDEWSQRRPLNPIVNAMVSSIVGERFNITLLVYSAVAAYCTWLVAVETARAFGVVPALFVLGVISYFSNFFLLVPLSETLGLILGCLGFVIMWQGIEDKRAALFALGLTVLTAGFSSRPGPMIVLPMLVFWAAFSGVDGKRISWKWAVYSVLAIIAGMLPTYVLGQHFGHGENIPASNFAYTLYGLSLGGESWQRAYTDLPEIMRAANEAEGAKIAFKAAIVEIINNPGNLLIGMYSFLSRYFELLFIYVDVRIAMDIIKILFYIGLLVMVFRIRSPKYSFLLAGISGCILSAPLIYWSSDAHRAFIVMVAFDAVIVAIAVRALCNPMSIKSTMQQTVQSSGCENVFKRSNKMFYHGFSALVLITLVPAMAIHAFPQKNFEEVACDDGLYSTVLHLGHTSPYMKILESNRKTFVPEVSVDDVKNMSDMHDYGIDDYFRSLNPGDIIIKAYDYLHPGEANGWFVGSTELISDSGSYYHICSVRTNLEESGTHWVAEIKTASKISLIED